MSRPFTASISSPSCLPLRAPAWRNTRIPSRKAISVGIDVICACWAISCSASVSTFANVISGFCSDIFSKIGPNILHGPHHSAQKSMKTMSLPLTVSSKVSSVISVVATILLTLPPSVPGRLPPKGSFHPSTTRAGPAVFPGASGVDKNLFAGAEESAAHPNHRGPGGDRDREILAHPHREFSCPARAGSAGGNDLIAERGKRVVARPHHAGIGGVRPDRHQPPQSQQIGRASCRERV